MTSIIKYILILTFLLPVSSVYSQKQYRKNYRIDDSKASCNIRALVIPDSLLIRGEMEITYQNKSYDTLSTINFSFPLNIADRSIEEKPLTDSTGKLEEINAPYYCILDSILYRGVPLDLDNDRPKKYIINLPQPLLPGEKGFFFLTFKSKISPEQIYGDVIHYNLFYPMINIYHRRGWLSAINWFYYDGLDEYSDYNVVLEVDSAYTLATTGRILNEKEIYGFLPSPVDDTVFVDVTHPAESPFADIRLKPLIRDGQKTYHIRADDFCQYSFMVFKDFKRDCAFADSVKIDVFYTGKNPKWQGFVAATVAKLIKGLEAKLGPFPAKNLSIVSAETNHHLRNKQNLIMLPPGIEDKDLLTAILAVRLANYYIPPIIRTIKAVENEVFIYGDILDAGMVSFVAANILYEIYGGDGYSMYRKYKEWFTGRISLGCLSKTVPVYFCFDMSKKFYMLETIIRKDVFWGLLRQYIKDFRYDFPTREDLRDYLSVHTDINMSNYFTALGDTSRTIDYNIKSVKVKKQKGSYNIEGIIENLGNWSLPVEIGFVVNYSDTIYDTVMLTSENQIPPYCAFECTLPKRPRAVVVDPNYQRADLNRKNNYYLMTPMKFRYYPPDGLFPGIEPREF